MVNPRRLPDLVIIDLFHDAVDLFIATPLMAAFRRWPRPLRASSRTDHLRWPRHAQCTELIERLAGMQVASHRLPSCGDLSWSRAGPVGIGVALLPRRVAAYGQRGRLTRLHPELPNFPDTISLVYRADLPRTVATGRLKMPWWRTVARRSAGDAHDPHEHPPATTMTPLPAERIDPRPVGTTSSRTPTTRRPRSKK